MGIKHPTVGSDDLRTLRPQVAAEWDAAKNAGLNILDYVAGSAKIVWWQCAKCGHKWRASVRARYLKGSGCPICARIKRGEKRIRSMIARRGCFDDVELLKDWDAEKNSLPPTEYTKCSNRSVWWKCHVCGYEWRAKISNRVNGRGCPACSGKVLHVGHNDLATLEPALAKEWHPAKNGSLKPSDVMRGQARKVWWQCSNGHAYLASINKRTSDRTGCPICHSGRQTSFREKAFYYYIKKVFPGTIGQYKPEWLGRMELDVYIPEKHLAIEYDGAAWHKDEKFERERRKYELCSNHGVRLWRVKEQMPENGVGLADKIFSVSDVETARGFRALILYVLSAMDPACDMWTRKDLRHVWTDVDVDLQRDRYEINQYRFAVKNSLDKRRPDLVAEWHPTKNREWTPQGLSWKSERKVWWRCTKCGHEYEMAVAHRVTGNGCPKCSKARFKKTYRKNVLAIRGGVTDPVLLAEWNYEKNGALKPDRFPRGCEDKVWWKCRTCGHEWLAKIANRSHGRGCPCCANRVVVKGKNDLLTLYPGLCKEWDYEKNGALGPDMITPGRNGKVWWICSKCGYSYAAPPAQRTRDGSGCRKCADKANGICRSAQRRTSMVQ